MLYAGEEMKIVLGAAVLYGFALLWVAVNQRKLMYHPETRLYTPHQNEAFAHEIVELHTADGLTLKAAYKAPENGKPTVIYFHGNTGIVADAMHKLVPLVNAGYGVLMPEYRGFGGNAGAPSEQGLIQDAEAALRFVREKTPDSPVVYYGMSMGTGVANALAEKFPPAALVQECGFTSMTAAAQHRYWFLPVKLLIKDTYNSQKRIASLTAPLLILHGAKDKTVPVSHAYKILQAAKSSSKTIKIYPDGHHIDLHDFGAGGDVLNWLNGLFLKNNKV
ncbi:MAG TPA: hypothetical protein DD624_00220 [Alphaproteobacteria bacterium]|nr:hypothetical protein [Alphaproteobacteria bacterium]